LADKKKVLWNLLFNEELERGLDPNDPANAVRIKVEKEREAERVKKLKGGILYEQLEQQIKKGVLSILQAPATTNCGCPSCNLIRGVNTLVEFWLNLEGILEKGQER